MSEQVPPVPGKEPPTKANDDAAIVALTPEAVSVPLFFNTTFRVEVVPTITPPQFAESESSSSSCARRSTEDGSLSPEPHADSARTKGMEATHWNVDTTYRMDFPALIVSAEYAAIVMADKRQKRLDNTNGDLASFWARVPAYINGKIGRSD